MVQKSRSWNWSATNSSVRKRKKKRRRKNPKRPPAKSKPSQPKHLQTFQPPVPLRRSGRFFFCVQVAISTAEGVELLIRFLVLRKLDVFRFHHLIQQRPSILQCHIRINPICRILLCFAERHKLKPLSLHKVQ